MINVTKIHPFFGIMPQPKGLPAKGIHGVMLHWEVNGKDDLSYLPLEFESAAVATEFAEACAELWTDGNVATLSKIIEALSRHYKEKITNYDNLLISI